jgi:hypothetical protein
MLKALLIAWLGICPAENSDNCVWDEPGGGVSFVALRSEKDKADILFYFGLNMFEVYWD